MKFAEPIWLLAGLAVMAALFGLFLRFDARQRAALAEFASSHLLARLTSSFSPGRRRIKRLLFSVGVGLIFVALARPQIGYHWEDEKQRGIDLLFAIDTSKSMLTQDVVPDRLTRAKLAVTDFVNKLEGDRVGLIAFAGDAFLQAPLTLDYDAFEESLDAVDTNVIPRGGTDVASAINESSAAFGVDSKNKKILILITDGEDLEAKGIDAAKAAAQKGLTIYTVGVGSPAGGLIPVPGTTGGTDFIKDDTGQFVKSHLDESTLKQIAQATGGIYEPLGQHGEGLEKLYNEALATLPKQDLSSRREKVYDERFQWPLGFGLAVLLASTLIGTRRREAKIKARSPQMARAGALTAVVAIISLASNAQASPQSAERAYKNGDYSKAEDQYAQAAEERPDVAPLQFNMGDAAYKKGDFDKALPAFQKALNTEQVDQQQQAYYNIGNTQYRVGQKTATSAPDDTIKQWQSAVQSYEAALKLKPDDADAKYNHDFVQKKLDQLQKQQQQKKDQQKQDQKQNQDQKQDQKQNQDQNQKSDSQQNQKQDQNNQQKPGSQDQKNQQGSGQQQNQDQQNQQGQGSPQDQKDNQANGQKPDDKSQGKQANGQDQKGANGQTKDQQQTAGNQGNPSQDKGQQPQANGGDQKQQVAQNQKPNGTAGQASPDKNGDQQASAAEAEQATPGVLSREEAKELLNSLKSSEHALPVTADARSGDHPQNETPLKDW